MQNTDKSLILFDIDYTLFDTDHYKSTHLTEFRLYDEVIPVLETLGKSYELGIFSEGDKERQLLKLVETMIDTHFTKNHKHILVKKLDALEEIFPLYSNKQVSLVDDKLTILKAIHEKYPKIQTIWVKRGPYALAQSDLPEFTPHATVATLKELLPLFTK